MQSRHPLTVGLTGGMGCGKTTTARLFERRGFHRLDSDAIVRDRVLKAPDVLEALQARFGKSVLTLEGQADRSALAARIFANDAERRWMEELTHPRVFAVWREAFAARPEGHWVVEVPLLFEQELENWFDFTVCVACSPAEQATRLEQRGLPRGLVGQRISKQLPLAQKIELSDFVLWNEGSLEFLQAEVDRLTDALVAA